MNAREQTEPIAHYDFQEGAGTTLKDKSGNSNHGAIHGATYARAGDVYALKFDGIDDYVDCGSTLGAQGISDRITMEIWMYPDVIPAGEPTVADLKGTAGMSYYPYGLNWSLAGVEGTFRPILPGAWNHIVGIYDGEAVRVYADGELVAEVIAKDKTLKPGKGLVIGGTGGISTGYGSPYFQGMIRELKIYSRALSEEEILEHYRTSSLTGRVGMKSYVYPFKKEITVALHFRGMGKLPVGASARVELAQATGGDALAKTGLASVASWGKVDATFTVGDLAPGTYRVRTAVFDINGAPVGTPSEQKVIWPETPSWPGTPKHVKVLNNVVAELLNVAPPELAPGREYTFHNPREGWVFFSSTADMAGGGSVSVAIGAGGAKKTIITHGKDAAGETLEAMRFLPAGEHSVTVSGKGKPLLGKLIVRAVPELIYGEIPTAPPYVDQPMLYGDNPHSPRIYGYGVFDWGFLKKHILKDMNCIMELGHMVARDPKNLAVYQPWLEEWRRQGKRWIKSTSIESDLGLDEDGYYDTWTKVVFAEPTIDGIVIDEFGWGKITDYPVWEKVVKRFRKDERFKGKTFRGYVTAAVSYNDPKKRLVRTINDLGYKLAFERYEEERPTQREGWRFLDSELTEQMLCWERAFPGCIKNMMFTLGLMMTPPETLNLNPAVDYKVWMDMYCHLIANAPVYQGTYAIFWYHAVSADEEALRWVSRLNRHYFIEGRTDMLSDRYGFKYSLHHIENPDFDDGTNGWTISPAEQGSVARNSMKRYNIIQGRYPYPLEGDNFLWMKRSARRPNRFSQEVRDLKPGKLYSVKLITADYEDLTEGRTNKEPHAIKIDLDNVEVVPEQSFQQLYKRTSGLPPSFKGNPAWLGYHYVLFRAKGETAKLTISDWQSNEVPGGPIGQELIYNFIELQPYFEE